MHGPNLQSILIVATASVLIGATALATDVPSLTVGKREVIVTKAQRDARGLEWFMDGNLGVVNAGRKIHFYGANGSKPVRVTGTPENPFQKVAPVIISTDRKEFQYLAGGPLFRDPKSKRIFLFYHAEIHRGSAKNFYSVLGLSIQTDTKGLRFRDLGPIFAANTSNENSGSAVEVCGSAYAIKDGCFYVYARDALSNSRLGQNNLVVAKARVAEVVRAGLKGRNATWMKYYNGAFTEPAVGGESTPLEEGNPVTRWMDVSYNTAINKFIMVVAANTGLHKVELFIAWSDDGIHWAKRRKIAGEDGESFYPSIIGIPEAPRQTGSEFSVFYTFSPKGGWERWADAAIVKRRITITESRHNKTDAGDGKYPRRLPGAGALARWICGAGAMP